MKRTWGLVRALRQDLEAAASTVVAFLLAGVIFVGSVGALLVVSHDAGNDDVGGTAESASLSVKAQGLADLLFASPGYTVTGSGEPVAWDGTMSTSGQQSLTRLGLRDVGDDQVSFAKVENLRRAAYDASATDGYVNYPEALQSLGLAGTGLDFHVRAFPSLKSVRDILATGNRDPNLRVAYIGDVEAVYSGGGAAFTLASGTGTATCTVGSNYYTISVPVTNTGATTTQLTGFFDVKMGNGNDGTFSDRTRTSLLVGPSGTETLGIQVPAKSGRSCTGATLGLEIWDPNSRLDKTNGRSITLSGSGTAASAVTKDLWLNPGRTYYAPNTDVVVDFDGDLPTCNPSSNSCDSDTLTLTVLDPGNAVVYGPTSFTVTKNVRSVTVPGAKFPADGAYTLSLGYATGGVTVQDKLVVSSTAPAVYTPASSTVSYAVQPPVAIETWFLDQLVDNFCGAFYDTASYTPADSPMATAPSEERCSFDRDGNPHLGDVYPDTRAVLNNDLHSRLIDATDTTYTQRCNGHLTGGPRYDWTRVLVVGSNVDHNSMTSSDAKYAVCEWVMGGGTLIVFGSADQQVQWLQPIFHAAIISSSGGVSTPDGSHPILNRADQLAYTSYDRRGMAWGFNGQTAQNQNQLLTNVVMVGTNGDSSLTVSNPGAFGDGSIILTTWLPYDLFNTGTGTSNEEGLKMVNNFLMQGYRDLFLDYGPSIPVESRQAAAAQRVVEIQHPEFEDPITLTVFVYVF